MNVENEVKESMHTAIEHLKKELKGIRTGRANPALLDNVKVDVYGASMRLRDIANVTVPESRQLLVTPYDPSNVNAIAKGIEASINFQPVVDGHVIRINIPPMDQNMRKEMIKQCKKKAEDAKVAIREIRRKYNEKVRKLKSEGEIPEDEMKRQEKAIQDLTDKFCKEVDTLCQEKEKEITEI